MFIDVIKEKCIDNLITFTLWTGTGREQVIVSKEYSVQMCEESLKRIEGEEPTPTPTVVPTATPTLTRIVPVEYGHDQS